MIPEIILHLPTISYFPGILREQPKNILDYDINQCLYTIHDYFAVVLGSSSKATFFLGMTSLWFCLWGMHVNR